MPSTDPADWIALNMLPGLGPLNHRRLLGRFGSPFEVAYRVPPEVFAGLPGVGRQRSLKIAEARKNLARRAAREMDRCRRSGIELLTPADGGYPGEFLELPDPPTVIYLRGDLRTDLTRVAVVGSRNATAYGRRVATGIGSGLVSLGAVVVSGGARGIDTCAHRGALAERGRTVAVVGSGLLQPYPVENTGLFEEIARSGALISEFGLDVAPRPQNFPRRNRLISALSCAVVVVEAATRSGSLNTASHALEQGREVLAVPGPVSSHRSPRGATN